MLHRILILLSLLFCALAAPVSAQNREVPYWASIKFDEMNMRVGPSREYPISWVYRRENLPVKVIRVVEGWRLIQDVDGTSGWVMQSQLNARRTAQIVGEGLAEMRETASANSKLRWNLQPGVIGILGSCQSGWCELDVKGHKGWVRSDRMWGTDAS